LTVGRYGAAAILATALLAGGCAEPRSNTGYAGTWRQDTAWMESTIAIAPRGDGYAVRFSVASTDGKRTVRCDWSGRCEERVDGRLVSTFEVESWEDPETGHLMVSSRRTILTPPEREEYQLDELEVSPDGLELWAHSHERGGQTFEEGRRPKRSYPKFSDRVEDPPEGGGGGTGE